MSGHTQETTILSLSDTITDSPTNSKFIVDDVPPSLPPHSAIPPVIPPDHPHRTLICCFDGTGDQFDSDNSNIVQLVSLLKKDDRTKQLIYYQAGIGTYTSPKIATPFMSQIRKTLDTMFAWNLDAHVMAGYEFLMQNYITGDKICLFGFSRGAYTARSLAGMLHKVGLLPAGNFQQVPFAYKMYTRTDHIGWEQSNEFKKAFSVDVKIEFIGVWDTVDSVGIIPKRLPFTTSNTIVHTFRHAVSLDERRAKFKANLWNRPTPTEEKLGLQTSAPPPPVSHGITTSEGDPPSEKGSPTTTPAPPHRSHTFDDPSIRKLRLDGFSKKNGNKRANTVSEDEKRLNTLERMFSEKHEQTTDIEEVWFAGCHCDVGGGAVSNKTRHSLARITLRWMIRECFKTNTGIMFKSEGLREIGLDPSTVYPTVKKRPASLPLITPDGQIHRIQPPPPQPIPIKAHAYLKKKDAAIGHNHEFCKLLEHAKTPFYGSEEEEELRDALAPKYDQLVLKRAWWTLEIMPLQLRYQRGDNEWVNYFGSNLAKPRYIPMQRKNGFKVHRSVKLRMEAEYEAAKQQAKGKRYIPKPLFKVEPTWVD